MSNLLFHLPVETINNSIGSVVAITGLGGHAFGSWRGKGALKPMWLRDFLAKDLKQCRILTFGYNSKVKGRGTSSLDDYSAEFLEELRQIRKSKEVRYLDR